jgi:hypothetical protein
LNQVFAEEYIAIGKHFQYWVSIENPSPDSMAEKDFLDYRHSLEALKSHCVALGLSTSKTLFNREIAGLKATVSYKDGCQKMGELSRCIEAEIASKMFFYIPSELAAYLALFTADGTFELGEALQPFVSVIEKYPSSRFDILEAGNCYATSGFTASVYHLMRICEYGLVSLAVALGIEPKNSSWNTLLIAIDKKIKVNSSTRPEGWKKDEEFFSEASGLMRNVKNSWRNASSHIPKRFDQPRARVIFNSVEALMVHLGTRLGEVAIPADGTVLADPEAKVEAMNEKEPSI